MPLSQTIPGSGPIFRVFIAGYKHCVSLGFCRAFPAPDSRFMYSACCSDAQWVGECRSTEAMAVACQSGQCKPVIGRPMAAGAARLEHCSVNACCPADNRCTLFQKRCR